MVAGGSVYVTGFDGNLSVFDAAGCGASACKLRWQGHTGNDITSSAAVAGGLALVGSADRLLYAFPAAGCGKPVCQPRWTAQLANAVIDSSVAVAGGVACVGDSGGRLYAFAVSGCGEATCTPLRAYDVGPHGSTTTPALVGDTLLASTQETPDPNTSGVVAAFPANGCGAALCEPLWTGVNFADGFESSPVVAGKVVFVGKGPASGFPVDAGVYAFDVRGCGKPICQPRGFTQLGPEQAYQGASIAVTGGKVMLNSTDNTGAPDIPARSATRLPGRPPAAAAGPGHREGAQHQARERVAAGGRRRAAPLRHGCWRRPSR